MAPAHRFTPCDLTTAIWRADMPKYVDPVFYDEPPPRPHHDDWEADDPLDEDAGPPARELRRRGHIRVIEGGLGRPMAG